jgi:uncharacterized protein YbaR (Trm112 family)
MISEALLPWVCCPETRQSLQVAEPSLIQEVNRRIAAGQERNRAGEIIVQPIDAGLVRTDRLFLYPVCQGLPALLIAEAIPCG